jgi:hypothetical protein
MICPGMLCDIVAMLSGVCVYWLRGEMEFDAWWRRDGSCSAEGWKSSVNHMRAINQSINPASSSLEHTYRLHRACSRAELLDHPRKNSSPAHHSLAMDCGA